MFPWDKKMRNTSQLNSGWCTDSTENRARKAFNLQSGQVSQIRKIMEELEKHLSSGRVGF